MSHGGNDIVFDASMIPTDAVTAMEAKRTAIKSGSFKVPVEDAKPT
jgi:basic membrane protein A and related proteins